MEAARLLVVQGIRFLVHRSNQMQPTELQADLRTLDFHTQLAAERSAQNTVQPRLRVDTMG